MKLWKKCLLGIVCIVFLLLFFAVIWWWPEISIITGTQALSEESETLPEVVPACVSNFSALNKSVDDWPCWRGSKGDGRSLTTGILKDWKQGLNKLWEVNFLCQSNTAATWSAPVIQGNRLVVCGRSKEEDIVFCLDPTNGNIVWKSTYQVKTGSEHGAGSRATPSIDDGRVYTFGRGGDLVCWNLLDGKKIWHKNVHTEGGEEPTWGHSSSPLVTGKLVIVQGGGLVRVVAYNKMTGDVVWKNGPGGAGYAAIVPINIEETQAILAFHGKGLSAISLESGAELWNIAWETSYDVNATTPIVEGNTVFITSNYDKGCSLLQVSKNEAKTLWYSTSIASHHSDPYIIDGFIYGYSGQSFQNKGSFKCLNAKTGEEMWSSNEIGWGTCVFVDGHLLCCDITGNLFLIKPDPKALIQVAEFKNALGKIRQGPAWTVPVIANGRLYLRFKQRLVCYDLLKK